MTNIQQEHEIPPNNEQIFGVFDDLMERLVRPRIYASYRRYATARDELIAGLSAKTGIAESEFHDHLARKMFDDMCRLGL